MPEKFIWRVGIALHCLPRILIMPYSLHKYFKNTQLGRRYNLMTWWFWLLNLAASILHLMENGALITLTYISSTDNFGKTLKLIRISHFISGGALGWEIEPVYLVKIKLKCNIAQLRCRVCNRKSRIVFIGAIFLSSSSSSSSSSSLLLLLFSSTLKFLKDPVSPSAKHLMSKHILSPQKLSNIRISPHVTLSALRRVLPKEKHCVC